MNAVVHNFQERLQRSNELSDEPSWIEFYRRLWPDMISAIRIDSNSKWQKWGVDRLVLLPQGKQFSIDEKKRDKDYGDLLIEEWSVGRLSPRGAFTGEKKGWSLDEDKRCDFVAYAIPPAGKCYLLPFELTRQTCIVNIERWKELRDSKGRPMYPKDAYNNGYVTRNCAVEWGEFKRCLTEQMLRKFGSELSLPECTVIAKSQMMIFDW